MVTCFLTSSSRSILKTLSTQQKAPFSRDVEDFSSAIHDPLWECSNPQRPEPNGSPRSANIVGSFSLSAGFLPHFPSALACCLSDNFRFTVTDREFLSHTELCWWPTFAALRVLEMLEVSNLSHENWRNHKDKMKHKWNSWHRAYSKYSINVSSRHKVDIIISVWKSKSIMSYL